MTLKRCRTWGRAIALVVVGAIAAAVGTATPAWAVATPAQTGASWPVFGADASNTRSSASGPAAASAALLHETWRFDCGCGDFTGTPIVAAGLVFAGSSGGHIVALNQTTGKQAWSAVVDGPINSSAAYDPANGHLYAAVARVGSPYVVALDASTGRSLWRTVLTQQPGSDEYASPQLYRGDVIIGTSALFAETQQSQPMVHGTVSRLAGGSGALVWQTSTIAPRNTGGGVWATAAIDPATGTAYVGTGNAYTPPADPNTDAILALDVANGRIVHAFQATPNDVWGAVSRPTGPDFDFGASPNLFTLPDGTRVVGAGQKSGVYWALRRTGLTPLWSTRVAPGTTFGGVLGSTATDGSRIYGPASEPAEVWALSTGGAVSWLEPNAEPLNWSPLSVSNGTAYATSSAGLLQAWDAATGAPRAAVPIAGPAFGGVSIAGATLFVETGTSFGTGGSVEAFQGG